MQFKRWLFFSFCLLLLGFSPALLLAETAPEVKQRWGVYEDIYNPAHYPEKLERCIQKLGYQPDYVLFFRDLRHDFPKQIIAAHPEITFVLSLELHEWRQPKGKYLQAIIDGKYDAFFKQWARQSAELTSHYFLRFGFEMSGKWFSWGGQPDLFQQAWKHVHAIFKAAGDTSAIWLFAPNVLYGSMTPENDLHPYYPGDAYVDWVGLDGYNFGDHHDKYHQWKTYDAIFEASIQALGHFSKPLLISEIGCADDKRKADWMRHFLDKVSRDPRVAGFVYFNYDKRSEGEPNWALNSDTASFKIFQDWLKRYGKPIIPTDSKNRRR